MWCHSLELNGAGIACFLESLLASLGGFIVADSKRPQACKCTLFKRVSELGTKRLVGKLV